MLKSTLISANLIQREGTIDGHNTVVGFFEVDLETQDNLAFAATYFFVLGLFETFDLMASSAEDSARAAARDPAWPRADRRGEPQVIKYVYLE